MKHQVRTLLSGIAPLLMGAATLTLMAPPSIAQTTGNQLLEWCQSNEQALEAVCLVHIDGMVTGQSFGATTAMLLLTKEFVLDLPDDAFAKWKSLKHGAVVGYCLPDGYSINQVRDIFVKHSVENPETRHQDANSILYSALTAAFPCER